jgi:hypothetical protein
MHFVMNREFSTKKYIQCGLIYNDKNKIYKFV